MKNHTVMENKISGMGRQGRIGCLAYLITLALAGAFPALGATVSWIGAGGNTSWHTAANWSGNAVPGSADDVLIDVPGDITVVFSTGSTVVRSLRCEENFQLTGGYLTLTAGSSYVHGWLRLSAGSLTVQGAGTTFTATGSTTNELAAIYATQGGSVGLTNLQRILLTLAGDPHFQATDPGSVVDLPNLTEAAITDYHHLELRAVGGGRVNAPRLAQLRAALDVYSDGVGSVVDLSGFINILTNTTLGSSYLEVRSGAAILLPNISAMDRVNLTIRGSGQVDTAQLRSITGGQISLDATTNNFPSLTNILGTHLSVENAGRLTIAGASQLAKTNTAHLQLTARDANSVIDLPNVTNLVFQPFYRLVAEAYDGGRISLPLLATLDGAIGATAQGSNAVIDLPGLRGRVSNPKNGAAYFTARNGGSILITNVTELNRIDVSIYGAGRISLAQLTAFNGATMTVSDCTNSLPGLVNVEAGNFTVDTRGRLTLAGLTQLVRNTTGDFVLRAQTGGTLEFPNVTLAHALDFYQLECWASGGGRIYLPRLATLNGAILVNADGTNSLVDLTGIYGRLANTTLGAASLEALNGGAILIPNVTELYRVALTIGAGGQINTTQLTAFTQALLSLDGATGQFPLLTNFTSSSIDLVNGAHLTLPLVTELVRTNTGGLSLSVDGAGSVLDLSSVTSAQVAPFYHLELYASAGGHILLPNLTSLTGALDVRAEDAGSLVDLSGLSGVLSNTQAGQTLFNVSAGGTVLLPNVTGLDQVTLAIQGTGSFPTAQLTSLTRSTVSIDGTTVMFLGLTDITGTTFQYLNGGAAVFQPPADFVVSQILVPASIVANQPVQVVWEIANQGTSVTNASWSDGLYLSQDANPTNCYFLGYVPASGTLLAGASLRFTNTLVLPAKYAGTWRLGVAANPKHTVFEGANYFNNTNLSVTAFELQAPDLIVLNLSVSTSSAQFGQPVQVTWTVKNAGTAAAVPNWTDALVLTTNLNALHQGVTWFTHATAEPLAPGASYTRTQTVALPLLPSLSAGTYSVVAISDVSNALPEGNETNNFSSATIALTRPPLPDLAVASIVSPATALPGQSVQLVWAVTNLGQATADGVWTERLSIARTNTGASPMVLGDLVFTNLIPINSSLTRTQTVLLPANLPAGISRFQVEVDYGQSVLEANESNNVASSAQLVNVPALLTLQAAVTNIEENAAHPNIGMLVIRNGDLAAPLTVNLASSDTGELTVPPTVVINAGQRSAIFAATVQADGIPDADQLVTITASAPQYADGAIAITVINVDQPHLALELAGTAAPEGSVLSAIVSRNGRVDAPVTVALSASGLGQLQVPAAVVIPAGANSNSFAFSITDDTLVEEDRVYQIEATAPGFVSTTASILVIDNDVPRMVLSLSSTEVSEGAGVQAAIATVSRGYISPRSLVVELENSNPLAALVPPAITIPGGQSSISFPVAAVDNAQVNGPQTVELRAFATTAIGQRISASDPVTLTVTDDDVPGLRLVAARDLLAEGLPSATTITVFRNAATNQPLAVSLISSDTAEATVPGTVTIPAGQGIATFSVATHDDGLNDGSKNVQITASAAGFVSGSVSLVVSDLNMPDLVVTEVGGPAGGESEAFVNVSYKVLNQGFAPAGTNWTTRVYLSADPVVGNDIFLTEYTFNGTLEGGQFFGQARQIRLPQVVGNYWVVVATDTMEQIDEILERNNTTISAQPIQVVPAYNAVVQADIESAPAGTVVPLRGSAFKTSTGGPAPFVLINIHLHLRGTRRVISALTDAEGNFAVTFTPLPGEAGLYEIGAAHPGVLQAPIQDSFTLLGMKADSPQPLKLIENASVTGQIRIENLGEIPLSGLAAQILIRPANIEATASLANADLPGLGTNLLGFAITALDASVPRSNIVFRITSAQGVHLDLPLEVSVESLRPRLVLNPDELIAGMKVGGQAFVNFEIVNAGGSASQPVYVGLPEVSWMHLATPNPLPGIEPGQTNRVTLQLTPPADMTLGAYEGWLGISAGDEATTLPFSFRALSEARGDLRVMAVDEYTYFAEGAPKVTNAAVTIYDAVTEQVVTNGVTDANGEFLASQLMEGYYRIDLTAEKHNGYRDTTLLVAGKENDVLAFLGRQAVQLIWTVTPTEIQDRTKITIEAVFEAFVPMPVITVDPPLIDLHDFTAELTQIDLKIVNHGLIAAQKTRLHFGTHPDWSFEPLISDLGELPARSTLVIPLLIRRTAGAATGSSKFDVGSSLFSLASPSPLAAASGGGCGVSASVRWEVACGGGAKGGGIPIPIINVSATGGCGGGGAGGGGTPGGGGDQGRGGGGSCGDSSQSLTSCDPCLLSIAKAIFDCALKFVLSDALKCAKGSYECAKGLQAGGNAGVAYGCGKAVLSCLAAAGRAVPGASLLKYPECAYGLLTACDGPGGGGGASLLAASSSGDTGGSSFALHSAFSTLQLSKASGSGSGTIILGSPPLRPELRPVNVRVQRIERFLAPMIYVCGDRDWLGETDHDRFDAWMNAFLASVEEGTEERALVSAAERAALLALPLPTPITPAKAGLFLDRWNRSITYWNAGIFTLAQVPPGQSTDFIATDTWSALADSALGAISESEAEGYPDPITAVAQYVADLEHFMSEGSGNGVCAHVRLRLNQEAVMTRDAFSATLEIQNDTSGNLDEIGVTLSVRRRTGEDVTSLFAVYPPQLSGLTAIDGTGVIYANSAGTATWTLVPTTDLARTGPEEFLISGVLKYRQDQLHLTVPLAPMQITVYPSASLSVKYFHQRDVFADDPFTPEVEPSVPYSLAIMVQNKGLGAARDVRITSAQPQIVENEKGLFVDFKIIATEVAGRNLEPSLTVDFGQIDPGGIAIGRWLLTSTILGGFIDYSATFEHLDALGDKKLSLVEGVTMHELIHIVKAPAPFDDGRPDFLVNDVADLYDRPDTLHLSDGSVAPVTMVDSATFNRAPTTANLVVQLSASLPSGWVYLRAPDPGTNKFRLARVVRADGVEVPFGDNVWTTDHTFLGNARRPLRENLLHIFDYSPTPTYTLYYANLPPGDTNAPSSAVAQLPAASTARIPVSWSGQDNAGGTGINFYDVYVSSDGGPFILWQKETLDLSAVFQGGFGRTYAFYSIATDLAGNREAPPLLPDAQTTVTRTNHAPLLQPLPGAVINEGDTLLAQALAADPDGDELLFSLGPGAPAGMTIHPYTGAITWVTGEGHGPAIYNVTVQVLDNGSPRLGDASTFQVTVSEYNSPPVLSPIANRRINEGELLCITNLVFDVDLPPQTLTFSLGPAPAGASIDPHTGIFQWQPAEFQGGTTNWIYILVYDDGAPAMSATQRFQVVVRDTQSDFIVGLGTTNLLVGLSSAVPLHVTSSADLGQMVFELEAGDSHLAGLNLQAVSQELSAAAFEPIGAGSFRVRLDFAAGQVQAGDRTVALLQFGTRLAGQSSIAPLRIHNLEAWRSGGEVLRNGRAQDGRIFMIENEPILDCAPMPAGQVRLVIYGLPSHRYQLHSSPVMGEPGAWQPEETFDLLGTYQVLERPFQGPTRFFRVQHVP